MTLIYHADKALVEWAAIKLVGKMRFFSDDARAIGMARNNQIIGACVYDRYCERPDGTPLSIEASLVTIDERWATRHNIRAIFKYPFCQLNVARVQLITSALDEGTNSVNSRLGFKKEGFHPKAYFNGTDAISWGMLKEDCPWLVSNG